MTAFTTSAGKEAEARELGAHDVVDTSAPGAIAARVARDARDGDVVIVMSSGAFGGVHEKILEALRS